MWREKEIGERERAVLAGKGFALGRLLGQGAFSRVYWVEEVREKEIFACKVSENAGLLEKEAGILAALRHPLFPEYFKQWQEAGLGFLLMEYVAGSSLEEMRARRGGFSERQVARVGMELAEGLLYLHERPEKLLFRDVKPANILIRQDGRVKLVDFGCVCSAREKPGSCAGSPGYAAPEQLREEGVLTTACDVYGLGQTMKIMLGAGEKDDFVKVREKRGTRRRLRKSLLQILDACTRQEPCDRILDMRGVMAALMPLAGEGENGRLHWGWRRISPHLKVFYQKNIFEPTGKDA